MGALYLQDAVTQITSHTHPEGLTEQPQVALKTPHTEHSLEFEYK